MSNYIVTGCAGFIGSYVTKLLLEQGHRVVGIDNLNSAYDIRLKEWRLKQLDVKESFRFVRSDIRVRSAIKDVFDIAGNGCDGVIHLAAYAGVRYSVENPWIYYETNVTGTLNLLDACVKSGVKKMVFGSSSSVYGNNVSGAFSESTNTDRVLSPYAASKKAAEELCFSYKHLHGIDFTILRFFTVYGPAGRPDMSPLRFVRWIYEGVPLTLYGNGTQRRDFTYVDDVARGVCASLKPLGYEIINLGNNKPIEIIEFIKTIEGLIGKKAVVHKKEAHSADVSATWADISKARDVLKWLPKYDIRKGLGLLVDWYEENRSLAKTIEL